MTTVILLRHGRSTSNAGGTLAGRTPGVELDETGRGQAERLPGRLAEVRIDRLVSSPLERCRETVAPLAAARDLPVVVEDDLAEVDYGAWTGRALKDLAQEKLWRVVQAHPSAAVFPEGEGLADVGVRAVTAVRRHVAEVGPDGYLVICSHGDVIKAVLADALGLHLDGFQRIVVAPASLSVIRYTELRPFVERINDTGDLDALRPPPPPPPGDEPTDPATLATAPDSDAVPGGVPD
jgi:probable phosphoglycerate mutase